MRDFPYLMVNYYNDVAVVANLAATYSLSAPRLYPSLCGTTPPPNPILMSYSILAPSVHHTPQRRPVGGEGGAAIPHFYGSTSFAAARTLY